MKRKMVNRLFLFTVLAVFVSACSTKQSDYTQVIPADATAVVSVDLNAMGNKAGLNDAENKELKNKMFDAVKSGLSAATSQQIEKILSNPSESGIDFDSPVYIFMAPSLDAPAMVAKVSDTKKLRTTLDVMATEQISEAIADADGYSYANIEGGVILAYNNSALIITTLGRKTHEALIAPLFANEGENSIVQNANFQKMQKIKGDICYYTNMESFPSQIVGPMRSQMQGIDLKDFMILGNLNFDKGKISAEVEYVTENEEAKAMLKKQDKVIGKIKNGFLNEFPLSSLMFFSLNINGEELFNLLSENEEFRTHYSLEDADEVKNVMGSMKGDISMALLDVTMTDMPTFVAYADADNGSALNILYKEKDNIGLSRREDIVELAPDAYLFKSREMNVYFGFKDKRIYATNSEKVYKAIGESVKESLKDARYASNVKGKNGYFVIDAEAILNLPIVKMAAGFGGKEMAMYMDAASRFSYLEIYGVASQKGEFNLYMTDKNTNALKQIVDLGKQFAGY